MSDGKRALSSQARIDTASPAHRKGGTLCLRAIPFENDFLKLVFHGAAIANLADNAASGPLTQLYVSLHTADPGEAGDQTTNETTYSGYARQAVARNSGGWAISGNTVNPVASIDFPVCASGSATLTHGAVGTAASGAGKILWSGAIGSPINLTAGNFARLTTASFVTED